MKDNADTQPEPKKVPKVVFGLAAVAVIGPLFLLRRLYTRTARLSLDVPAPPIRRAGSSVVAAAPAPIMPSSPSSSSGGGSFNYAGEDDDDWGVQPPPLPEGAEETSQVQNTLWAFGAIGLATAAVGVFGATLFWGVKTWMGVENTDEFARRVRASMPHSMPVLNERMDTSLKADATPSTATEYGEGWTWAAAQERLARAYEEGGTARWSEQLAREGEAEARLELAKRQQAASDLELGCLERDRQDQRARNLWRRLSVTEFTLEWGLVAQSTYKLV